MKRKLIGMLTPSSNTVLEPYTGLILSSLLPEVSAHFGRFRVTRIGLDHRSLDQFEPAALLAAADLLADAKVDVIAWNGTSAGWLGFETDQRLCERIRSATGIAATSSVLALNELFERASVRRFALVTPYTDDVQQRIIANYAAAGYECVAERHLGDDGNFAFAEVSEARIEQMIREVAGARPEAIVILCTNLRGARVAARVEAELGIAVFDSVSVTVWKTLRMSGVDPRRIREWGRLFEDFDA